MYDPAQLHLAEMNDAATLDDIGGICHDSCGLARGWVVA